MKTLIFASIVVGALSSCAVRFENTSGPGTTSQQGGGDDPTAVIDVTTSPSVVIALNYPDTIKTFAAADDGLLTAVGNGQFGRSNTNGYATHPNGQFLYVPTSDGIRILSLKTSPYQNIGSVTELRGESSPRVFRLTIDVGGKYLLASGSGYIHRFLIDSVSGALTELQEPSATEAVAYTLLIAPSRKHFYAMLSDRRIHIFDFETTTGSLSNRRTLATTDYGSFHAAITLAGDKLIMVGTTAVTVLLINPVSGDLTEVAPTIRFSSNGIRMAIDRTGSKVFVSYASSGGSTIKAYRLNRDTGELTATNLSVEIPGYLNSMETSHDRKTLFVSNSQSIMTYSILEGTGFLAPLTTTSASVSTIEIGFPIK